MRQKLLGVVLEAIYYFADTAGRGKSTALLFLLF